MKTFKVCFEFPKKSHFCTNRKVADKIKACFKLPKKPRQIQWDQNTPLRFDTIINISNQCVFKATLRSLSGIL